jgi:glutathione synthase/RimK-type ligase-like ATP-grasp enzyme
MKSFIVRYSKMGVKSCPWIADEAGLDVFTNQDAVPKDGYMFRWGTTSDMNTKAKVVNKIDAIYGTADKIAFRKKLVDDRLCPPTWFDTKTFRQLPAKDLAFPLIVRPAEHQRSEDLYVCNDAWEIMDAIEKIRGPYYMSMYIKKVQEFRVFITSGRVAWVIEKMPKDKEAVSWGCIREGDFEYVAWEDWNLNVVDNAIKAFNKSDLDFGAVDVILNGDGTPYTLEINTAPYLTEYYARTIGKTFKHIVDNGRDRFPIREIKDWKDAIHPAVSNKARV